MATQLEVMQSFMAALDTTTLKGTAALDEAIQACSNFSGIQAVITKMKSDIAATNNAEKFLKDYCGIDLSNTDTGAITGADAGDSKVKTAASIVPESGSLDTSFKENYFTLSNYGVTFYLRELDSDGRVTGILSFDDLTPQQQYIWRGLKTWWASNALALVTESYGSNFKFSSTTSTYPKIIYFGFYNRNDTSLAESGPLGAEGEASTFVFRVNMNKFDSINTSDANGIANNGNYLDSTMAHEFTHCVMAANIKYYTSLPQFIREGMAELTIGGDGDAYLEALANKSAVTATGTNKSWLDTALDLTNVSTGDAKAYAGGYMFLRYLAKQAADGGITEGADSIKNTVSSATINALGGNDTITNSGYYSKLNGGDGKDLIKNDAWNVTIDGGAGNDTITSYIDNYISVVGGAGDDLISLNSIWYSTVDGGAGNDTIISSSNARNDSINGGAGNDLISLQSSYSGYVSTVVGGTGNDTIYSDAKPHLFKYTAGDGNDKIVGFNATTTLQIGGGTGTYSSTKSANDMIVTVGEGKITLTGAATLSNPHIDGVLKNSNGYTDGADSIKNTVSGKVINALGGNDTIYNAGNGSKATIYGGAGNDSIKNFGTLTAIFGETDDDIILSYGGKFSKIYGGDGNDRILNGGNTSNSLWGTNSTLDGGNGNDSISNWSDSVSIAGGAGNDSIYNDSDSITMVSGTGNDFISLTGNAEKNLIKYTAGDGNDKIVGFNATTTLQIGGGTGTYSSTKSANDMIVTVGESKITLTGAATLSNVHIDGVLKNNNGYTDGADSVKNTVSGKTINALGGNDTISNTGHHATIYGGAGNDSIKNTNRGGALTLAGAYSYIDAGDGNDYVLNYDYADYSFIDGGAGADTVLNRAAGSTVYGGAGNDSIKNITSRVWINGGAGHDSIKNSGGSNVKIAAGTGNDSITSSGSKVSINSGSGNNYVYLYADALNTTVLAGNGKNTIGSGAKTALITTGKGNDSIKLYADNEKSTVNSGAGDDTVEGGGLNSSINTGSGNDSIKLFDNDANITVNAGSGSDKIYSGSQIASINASSGNDYVYLYAKATKNTVRGGAGNDTILGNAGNDKIYGDADNDYLKGGAGNDSFSGGKGNDSLWGDAGADTFFYSSGDGKDVIFGFENNDMLKITGTFSASYKKSNDAIYFKVGSTKNAITLKNFDATSFNINGINYKISGSKLVRK